MSQLLPQSSHKFAVLRFSTHMLQAASAAATLSHTCHVNAAVVPQARRFALLNTHIASSSTATTPSRTHQGSNAIAAPNLTCHCLGFTYMHLSFVRLFTFNYNTFVSKHLYNQTMSANILSKV